MAFNSTQIHAPWAYESLPDQKTAQSQYRYQIMQSIVFGGYVWDIIISCVKDYQFVFYRRFNHVTCLYITNRLAATLTIVGYFVLSISTTVDCGAINKMTAISEGVCQFMSSALLSLRIWVLYRRQIYVPIFMTAFLFPGPIINIIAWTPLRLASLPSPGGCGFLSYPPGWESIPFILQAIYDLLVFLLCLVKLLRRSDLSVWHLGKQPVDIGMRIRREFLNGGFVYYIPNIVIQVVNLVFITNNFHWGGYLTASASDVIASAQSLRITRSLWKSSLPQQNTFKPYSPQTGSDKDKEKTSRSGSETETPGLETPKEEERIVYGELGGSQV